MALVKRSRRVDMTLTDDSGYSFDIEAEECYTVDGAGQRQSGGWFAVTTLSTGPSGLHGMRTCDSTLPVLLEHAKQLVRMLEESVGSTYETGGDAQ